MALWLLPAIIALLVCLCIRVPLQRTSMAGTKAAAVSGRRHQHRKQGKSRPVYPNGWFALLPSTEVPVGAVRPVDALGNAFVVFRGFSGNAFIMDAFCPHIGAHMGIGGKVKDDCIVCPFHEWCFQGVDGSCKEIPYSTSVPKAVRVRIWPCWEGNGFLYVWHHVDEIEPYWFPEKIKGIHDEGWSLRGFSNHAVQCHIQDIPENGSDISHFPAVHSSFLFGGSNSILTSSLKHKWIDPEWRPGSDEEKHLSYVSLTHKLECSNIMSILNLKVKGVQIGPGIVHLNFESSWGKCVLVQNVTPLEPNLQSIRQHMYSPMGVMALYSKLVFLGELIMLERDIDIWNNKIIPLKPTLVKEDKQILNHRRWYNQFYSPNSPTIESLYYDIDW